MGRWCIVFAEIIKHASLHNIRICVCVSLGKVYLCLVWLVRACMCSYAFFLLRVRFHCWCDAVE